MIGHPRSREGEPANAEFFFGGAQGVKYKRWYDQIIECGRGRRLSFYCETHHILPRSLGGTDDPDNLVDLTYREHFLVHWLLIKITSGKEHYKMIHAFNAMVMPANGQRLIAGWQFEVVKRVMKIAVRRRRAERKAQNKKRAAEAYQAKSKAIVEAKQRFIERVPTITLRGNSGNLGKIATIWLNGGKPLRAKWRHHKSKHTTLVSIDRRTAEFLKSN